MQQNKRIAITIAAVLTVVLLAAIIWPMSTQRNQAIDRAIENDFSVLSTQVESYYRQNRRLPNDLDDLKLDDEVESRATKYNYNFNKEAVRTYELCAEFKTDTTSDDDAQDDIYYSSSYYKARSHTAGYDCIEYDLYSSYYYDDSPAIDLFEGAEESFEETESFDL